jgi:uncharacterized HAD superfamily protein
MGNICLDLDGIITDIGAQVKEYMIKIGLEADPIHVGEALLTPDGVEHLEHIFQDTLFWRNLLPIKDSWHCINRWFEIGHNVIFITARSSDVSRNEIENWLDGWHLFYNDFIVTDMYEKHVFVKKLNPILFVDDNPNEIKTVLSHVNTDCRVMRTWYNDHLIGDIPSISKLSEIKIGPR